MRGACDRCGLAQQVANVPMCCPMTITGLKKGETYQWCSCGQSSSEPFCDGTSCAPGFGPLPFTVNVEQARWSICNCKYAKGAPLCDGRHGSMPATPDVPPCCCDKRLDW